MRHATDINMLIFVHIIYALYGQHTHRAIHQIASIIVNVEQQRWEK